MNPMEYLNQITHGSKPQGGNQNKLISPLMIKILIVGAALFIVLLIVGGMLSGMGDKPVESTKQLTLRMTNLSATAKTYGKSLVSTRLRSTNTSLQTTIANTTRDLNNYLSQKYSYTKPTEELSASETEAITTLNTTLENARLNGLLDDTYTRTMSLQIVQLLTTESDIYNRTSDDQLKSIMSSSTSDLRNIYNSLSSNS